MAPASTFPPAGSSSSGNEGLWAAWHMPNPAGAGLPNPASYTLVTGGPAGPVVHDNVTGLDWRQESFTCLNFATARDACASVEPPGTWRVPSRIELLSLVDFTRSGPAIDTTFFAGTTWGGAVQNHYLTSTPTASTPGVVWTLDFLYGLMVTANETSPRSVRCVK